MTEIDNPGVRTPPPLMFAVALLVGVLIDGEVAEAAQVTGASQIAAISIATGGIILIVLSLGLFRRFRTRPEPWQPSTALITSGLYRFSRNPMYLGMAVLSVGISLYFESIVAAALLAIVVVIMDRYVIAREELYLTRQFGSDFDAYRAKVRRWL